MVGALAAAGVALRAGLVLRRTRRLRQRRPASLLATHLRFAKPAVLLLLLGFAAGPVSAVWLRDWDAFATLHGWLGLAAAVLFATAAVLGRRLQQGHRGGVDAHGVAGLLAVLLGAVAAVAGFVLLP